MAALPILILASLVVLGAGLVPGVALPMAAVLLAVACLRPLPPQRSFRFSLWLLLALVTWTLGTLVPAPAWAGTWRTLAWADIQAFTARHGPICGLSASGPVLPRLSLHPSGTLRWLVLVLGATGMYCLTASLRARQRLAMAKALVALGGLVAVTGLVGRYLIPAGDSLMWWFPVAEIGGGVPFGPFVNRNHFAAFCALLIPLALALTCATAESTRDDHYSRPAAGHQLSLDVSLGGRLLYGICLGAMMSAVLCSQSRGGTAAALLGPIVVALLWMRRGPAAAALATLAGVGAFLLVAVWPNAGFQGRLHGMRDATTALGARWPVWLDSVRIWSEVPLAGCGANGFGMVFPRVTTWATEQQAGHAESDYLQLLAEGGLIGTLMLAAVLVACCLPLLTGLQLRARWSRRRRGDGAHGDDVAGTLTADLLTAAEPPAPARLAPHPDQRYQPTLPYPVLAGVAAALLAVGLQSGVDVPLRVPLCAWAAAAIAGLAAAPLRRRGSGSRRALLWAERGGLAALLAGVVVVGWVSPGWRALYRDRDAWLAEAARADIVALLVETPTYWQAWYELGDRLSTQAARASGPEQQAAMQAAGWDALRAACRCRPRDPRLRAAFSRRLWAAGERAEARSHRDVQLALLPGDRGARMYWLQAEWQAGQTEECHQLARRFADENPMAPTAADYLVWLAKRELAEGSVTRACSALLGVLERRPGDPDALKGLAQGAKRLGQPAEEARWLTQLAASGRADAATWWRLGELARDRRDQQALREALLKAVQLEPRRHRAADAMWQAFSQERPHPIP